MKSDFQNWMDNKLESRQLKNLNRHTSICLDLERKEPFKIKQIKPDSICSSETSISFNEATAKQLYDFLEELFREEEVSNGK